MDRQYLGMSADFYIYVGIFQRTTYAYLLIALYVTTGDVRNRVPSPASHSQRSDAVFPACGSVHI